MLPRINQMLYMTVQTIDPEMEAEEFKARICDVRDNNIYIEVPISTRTGQVRRLYAGDVVSVYYLEEGGVKHYFQTSVIGHHHDVLRQVILRAPEPSAVTRVQRRSFLRVPAMTDVAIKLNNQFKFVALTEDVGGGGISFRCEQRVPIAVNHEVEGCLLVPYRNGTLEHAFFKAVVVRIKPLENERQLVMLHFSDIRDAERQKVIRFCFERQLENRKA
ncbi:flagellar brake protein [Paenibacillus thermoaerophilus]|uniref:Flagellar brake protein n=1 Tax=Paenibacillus thermoaerophilus TaxID=1215385 RepID=A0ABW2V2T2_9BACL|nr:flagellar brake domain-containing protein [Paenibacillus thermoaerophilus]